MANSATSSNPCSDRGVFTKNGSLVTTTRTVMTKPTASPATVPISPLE